MFCAFENPALILRIYGHGRAILPQDSEWDSHIAHFTMLPGARQIFLIRVDSAQTCCGWGVPYMRYEKSRETLTRYHAAQDPRERLAKISARTKSIDGLAVRVQTRLPHAERGGE